LRQPQIEDSDWICKPNSAGIHWAYFHLKLWICCSADPQSADLWRIWNW
jgi:hypothetical protein